MRNPSSARSREERAARSPVFRAVFILILSTAIPYTTNADGPAAGSPAVRTVRPNGPAGAALSASQTHAGPAVHSIGILSHDMLETYLREYRSPAGIAWLQRCMDRARPYRDFIADRIGDAGIPPEILFLPVIESAFYERAVSRSGAVGLWQFMMNSIYPYDMTVDEWRDDRRDFWKSTEAALSKLKDNYAVLGDWLLALGAYNCGLGCLTRAVKKAGTTDFWALADGGYLPDQTVRYVPKFLAAAHVSMYAGRYGLRTDWEPASEWSRIPVNGVVNLRMLAEETGAPVELLLRGNAELEHAVTPPSEGTYLLKVPSEYADSVTRSLEERITELMDYHLHVVESGDTLYALSRHFSVPVSLILRYNPGVRAEALAIGTRLVVPAMNDTGPYPRVSVGLSFEGTYTVAKGDTLWAISRRFGTRPEDLATENGISMNEILDVGRVLKVPVTANAGEESGG